MARTWSNVKIRPSDLSAAQRARMGRPSSLTAFSIALVVVTVFVLGLTLYSAYTAETHPLTEIRQSPADAPKDQ